MLNFNFIFIDSFVVEGYRDKKLVLVSSPMTATFNEILEYCEEIFDDLGLDSAHIVLTRNRELFCIVSALDDDDEDDTDILFR